MEPSPFAVHLELESLAADAGAAVQRVLPAAV
jgi:hypothetical protein